MFQQVYQFVLEQLGKNDLIAGGAMLAVLAYIANSLRSVPFQLMKWSRLLFVTQIDIPDRAETFKWISNWLSKHPYTARSKRVTVETKSGVAKVTPAPGRHFLWWKGRPLVLYRARKEGTGDNAHRAFRESWDITMIGGRKYLTDFIDECKRVHEEENSEFIDINEADVGYWEVTGSRRKRSLDSVILPCGLKTVLMNDLNSFIESKPWYEKMNIPWRRGYLLTGPPGNGKSSIITAVASELNFDIYIVNLRQLSESALSTLMGRLDEKCILLLEDIDCAFEDREGKTAVSLSTMLNLLDGVNASEGRVVFMTTNHPEKLDRALTRPGRVDLRVDLPNATFKQIEKLFLRFFPESKNATDFARLAIKYNPSMATLQGYLLLHKDSMRTARENIKDLEDAALHSDANRLPEFTPET